MKLKMKSAKIKKLSLSVEALLFMGCAVKKPDTCEKERIMCVQACNNSLCKSKCEKSYQECIGKESINGLGNYLYNVLQDNNRH